jgi:7-keto-8-aminopelargonate synthetase-like enzyme
VRVYSRRIVRCQSKLGISKFLVVARETIAQVTAEAIAGGYISPPAVPSSWPRLRLRPVPQPLRQLSRQSRLATRHGGTKAEASLAASRGTR